jgi:hypothetical protein
MNNRKIIIWGHKFPSDTMRSAMDFVRDHHTYVSRLKTMFSILD